MMVSQSGGLGGGVRHVSGGLLHWLSAVLPLPCRWGFQAGSGLSLPNPPPWFSGMETLWLHLW